jgi:hypothetical protein
VEAEVVVVVVAVVEAVDKALLQAHPLPPEHQFRHYQRRVEQHRLRVVDKAEVAVEMALDNP